MTIGAEERRRMTAICEDCRRSLEQKPTSLPILRRLGYALWILGDYQEVEEVCSRILILDPDDVDWLYSRAMAYLGLGQTELAVGDLVAARSRTDDHRLLAVIAEALESIENLCIRQADERAA